MYSSTVQKICKYCQWAKPAVGVENYMRCDVYRGFFTLGHSCINFKYDIFKKDVHRLPDISSLGFTAADFSID